jgi:hypothetical protein
MQIEQIAKKWDIADIPMRVLATSWSIAGCHESLEAGSWGALSNSVSRSSILTIYERNAIMVQETTCIFHSISNL